MLKKTQNAYTRLPNQRRRLDRTRTVEQYDHTTTEENTEFIIPERYQDTTPSIYMTVGRYKFPVMESELTELRQRADQYLEQHGVLIGFLTELLYGHED